MRNSHGFLHSVWEYKNGYYFMTLLLHWLLRSKLDPYLFVTIVWIGKPSKPQTDFYESIYM